MLLLAVIFFVRLQPPLSYRIVSQLLCRRYRRYHIFCYTFRIFIISCPFIFNHHYLVCMVSIWSDKKSLRAAILRSDSVITLLSKLLVTYSRWNITVVHLAYVGSFTPYQFHLIALVSDIPFYGRSIAIITVIVN